MRGAETEPLRSRPGWVTHQRALKVEGVCEHHVSLPVLDLDEAGALGGAAVLGGGLPA